jgi:YesN/AraC family two-component response regulator
MSRKSILLVEDDEPVRSAIRDVLKMKYKVLEASGYPEAMKQAKKPVDLAVIDYSLPVKDGFQLLNSLRKKHPALPAIIITAYSNEELAIQAVRAGVTDYLRKPLTLKHLLQRVSEILRVKKEEEEEYTEMIKSRKEFLLDSIAMYIEKSYRERDLSLERLSATAHMDRYSFCRAFKQRFGQNFSAYINNIRIRNAVELLKNADLSIAEVAFLVGYRSPEYFNRVFKKIHGMSPKEYRERLGDNGIES